MLTILLTMISDLEKAFTAVVLFFLISGAYFLIKPSPEDKEFEQQLKMYPIGFHCKDQNGETVVIQIDRKSQISVNKDKKIYKYTVKNALYHENEKKPFGCLLSLEAPGVKKEMIVYLTDRKSRGIDDARYVSCDDKDLIYRVTGKSAKKKLGNIRIQL